MKKLLAALSFVIFAASFAEAANFKYKSTVTLGVGESSVIYGVRDRDCGDKAPAWSDVRSKLPASALGSLSDGGAGTTDSKKCGGKVGARGIIFKATKAGIETITINGDPIKITVK